MIVKVRKAGTEGWVFYGHIAEVDTTVHYDHGDKLLLAADDHYRTPAESRPFSPNGDQSIRVTRLVLINTKGEEKSIVFDTMAYLLNDEGKTIERI